MSNSTQKNSQCFYESASAPHPDSATNVSPRLTELSRTDSIVEAQGVRQGGRIHVRIVKRSARRVG